MRTTTRHQGCDWADSDTAAGSVAAVELRDGVTVMLSQFAAGDQCQFHHVEPEDVFGIGFHLHGGSRFEMDDTAFQTAPLDVWASAAPRGSGSSFILHAGGFQTVSIRFAPDAAQDMLRRHAQDNGIIADLVCQATTDVATARLAPLDPAAARIVKAMFATPYAGAARTLFLESCALGLLAAQFDAVARVDAGATLVGRFVHQDKILAARDWLDAHLSDPPTIAGLARLVGTNEFTLKRAFKETMGTTVFGYVRQRRMEAAAADLHGGRSVADAAALVGYECPRCFADAFRRHFGHLPSEITRQRLRDIPARTG